MANAGKHKQSKGLLVYFVAVLNTCFVIIIESTVISLKNIKLYCLIQLQLDVKHMLLLQMSIENRSVKAEAL